MIGLPRNKHRTLAVALLVVLALVVSPQVACAQTDSAKTVPNLSLALIDWEFHAPIYVPPGSRDLSKLSSLVNSGSLKLSKDQKELFRDSIDRLRERIEEKRAAYARLAKELEGNEIDGPDLKLAEDLEIKALVESAARELREFFATDQELTDAHAAQLRTWLTLSPQGFNLVSILGQDWVRRQSGVSDGQLMALKAMRRSDAFREAYRELVATNPSKNRSAVLWTNMDGYPAFRDKIMKMQLSVLSWEEAKNLDAILQLDEDDELSLLRNWKRWVEPKKKAQSVGKE
ncbi:MAG: hypothetical protein AAF483_05200 [Planctomycetota bacterium]